MKQPSVIRCITLRKSRSFTVNVAWLVYLIENGCIASSKMPMGFYCAVSDLTRWITDKSLCALILSLVCALIPWNRTWYEYRKASFIVAFATRWYWGYVDEWFFVVSFLWIDWQCWPNDSVHDLLTPSYGVSSFCRDQLLWHRVIVLTLDNRCWWALRS